MSPRPARVEPAALLDAAARVIAARGIAALRLRDVADEAGVSVGLLQYRFGSREDLVAATLRRAVEAASEQWEGGAGTAPAGWARIVALIRASLRADPEVEARWRRWAVMAAALANDPGLHGVIGDPHARWREPLEEAIRDAVARGEARPVMAPPDAAAALSAMIDGLGFAAVGHGDGMTMDRAREIGVAHAAALLRIREAGPDDAPAAPAAVVSAAPRPPARRAAAARASRGR